MKNITLKYGGRTVDAYSAFFEVTIKIIDESVLSSSFFLPLFK